MKMRAKADSTSGGGDVGWAVMSTLIGGFAVWGGIGWLLDRWWHTHFLTPVGLILGMGLGIYAVVARFGPMPPATPPAGTTRPHSDTASRPLRRPPADPRRETQ